MAEYEPLKFLSHDALKEMTGYKQPAAIVRWLQKRGIPYLPRPNGWPAVAHSCGACVAASLVEALGSLSGAFP